MVSAGHFAHHFTFPLHVMHMLALMYFLRDRDYLLLCVCPTSGTWWLAFPSNHQSQQSVVLGARTLGFSFPLCYPGYRGKLLLQRIISASGSGDNVMGLELPS